MASFTINSLQITQSLHASVSHLVNRSGTAVCVCFAHLAIVGPKLFWLQAIPFLGSSLENHLTSSCAWITSEIVHIGISNSLKLVLSSPQGERRHGPAPWCWCPLHTHKSVLTGPVLRIHAVVISYCVLESQQKKWAFWDPNVRISSLLTSENSETLQPNFTGYFQSWAIWKLNAMCLYNV